MTNTEAGRLYLQRSAHLLFFICCLSQIIQSCRLEASDTLNSRIDSAIQLPRTGRTDEAIQQLQEFKTVYPENIVLRIDLSLLVMRNNQYQVALDTIKPLGDTRFFPDVTRLAMKLLRRQPDSLDAYESAVLGNAYANSSREASQISAKMIS